MITFLHVVFDGLAFGMLLLLMTCGLSITVGFMGFLNLSHGTLAMLGGYVASILTSQYGWPFLLTLPVAFLFSGGMGLLLERLLYRHFYQAGGLNQMLLTIGVVYMMLAGANYLWGANQAPVQVPTYLMGQITLGPFELSSYRLFIVLIGAALLLLMAAGFEYTRFGNQILAAVEKPTMAAGLGIPIQRLFCLTFLIGSGLAGLGGALSVNLIGLAPSFPLKYLAYFLILVAVSGRGSIWGLAAACAFLGILDMLGKYYLPSMGAFILFLMAVLVLIWRPQGWFGKEPI